MLKNLSRFLKSSKGATAIEYALIASLIAVVAISGMKLIGTQISTKLNAIGQNLSAAGSGTAG
ncbi:MAG: Flp family type IVb pilin [Alphaproteobacteria bacterium]|nr:Flp family type IVb pilin [Alphaproteobacteria bacterium]